MDRYIIAIALNTTREIIRQPIFYSILCGGIALILFSFSFTLFAFGEEIRMIQEMGISTITICCLCLTSLCATNTLSREVEKGTLMTLLSKPIRKRSILLGKFLGILTIAFLTCTIMGTTLIISLSIKDSREFHLSPLTSFTHTGFSTFVQLFLSFLQICIISAIAVAGSLYLSMAANVSLCIGIYTLGNVMNFFHTLFQCNGNQFPWCISLLSVFLPNLEGFSSVGLGNCIEKFHLGYMALHIVYAMLYITLVMALVFEFFDTKECY